MTTRTAGRLIDRLPPARGRLRENAPLAGGLWFRVGGPAEALFHPADREDLAGFLAALPPAVPVSAIGLGSNLLVRDGGVPGVAIRLGRPFAGLAFDGARVTAGAGASGAAVARACRDRSIAGLEFLSGIPGTIGGALRMNAGAYGRDMSQVVISAEAIDRAGAVHLLTPRKLGFAYRHCAVAEDWTFLSASLAGAPGDRDAIAGRMAEIGGARNDTQPVRARTGGSTFKNPPGAEAWRLIDQTGCRGLTMGGAMVSELHCNFLVNTGTATAAELEALGEEVRRRVRRASGVELEWEIRRLGVSAGRCVAGAG